VRETALGSRLAGDAAGTGVARTIYLAPADFFNDVSLQLCHLRSMADVLTVLASGTGGRLEELDEGSLQSFAFSMLALIDGVKKKVDQADDCELARLP
jgi:hypothetical protein